MLDTIAEDEKEAAVELSSYALLHAKAPRQNLSYTTRDVGKSSMHGEKLSSVVGKSSAPGKMPAVLA
uniref:Uncharacterized protein n=1 Tax=Arundo donax TaxID=35708 RepID=A0A0A9GIG0_ARUDO